MMNSTQLIIFFLQVSLFTGIHYIIFRLTKKYYGEKLYDGFPHYSWVCVTFEHCILYPIIMGLSFFTYEGTWSEYLYGGEKMEWFELFLFQLVIGKLLSEFFIFQFDFMMLAHHVVTLAVTLTVPISGMNGHRLQFLAGILCEIGSGCYDLMCVYEGKYFFEIYEYGQTFSNICVFTCCCLYFWSENNFWLNFFLAMCGWGLCAGRTITILEHIRNHKLELLEKLKKN